MKIRKANSNDISKIDEIYISGTFDEQKLQNKKLNRKDWIKMMSNRKKIRQSSMKKDIQSPNQYWLVAQENDIIGFGQISKSSKTHAEIEKLYVDKKFRKRGAASLIEKELENWAKKKKVEYVYSRILIKNTPSINFHKKFGFKQTSIRMDKKL